MTAEILGFAAGLVGVAAALLVFLKIERGRAIALTYGRGPERTRGGNALIWPSR